MLLLSYGYEISEISHVPLVRNHDIIRKEEQLLGEGAGLTDGCKVAYLFRRANPWAAILIGILIGRVLAKSTLLLGLVAILKKVLNETVKTDKPLTGSNGRLRA